MDAPTIPVPRRRLRFAVGVAAFTALAVILFGAGAAAWVYLAIRSALPQLDGTVPVHGLGSRVSVIRDHQGVPHIAAATLDDLFLAQGYITAQDRLWQMDMLRRYGAGELAEVLGPRYVSLDRQQRTFRMPDVARKAAAHLPPRERAYFEDYARGVNTFITEAGSLPIEFRLLRYRPRPWTVVDSLLVAGNLVQTLNLETLPHELAREAISARLGPEMAADLYPNSSWRDHPPVVLPGHDEFVPPEEDQNQQEEEQPAPPLPPSPRLRRKRAVGSRLTALGSRHFEMRPPNGARRRPDESSKRPRNSDELLRAKSQAPTADSLFAGSNNWVVSGAHTVSGKPLLANDMHLSHTLPNVWYEAHLTSGAFDVAGVSLPGMPFVIVGHNQRIAWGFTNLGPSVADVFVEYFNANGEYLTPDGWRKPETRREKIKVHGRADEDIEITITRHGPIISGLSPEGLNPGSSPHRSRPPERRQLALKWTAYEPDALQVPFFELDSAQDWGSFREAMRHFTSPAQNVVFADVDGHIGYQATGMIPIRAAGDGALPIPGADNNHEWTGYVPFEQLPSVFDPPSGVIATANGRIAPDGYPFPLSNEWGSPYRTARIYKVLGTDRKLTPADMLALQTDVYSEFDRYCAERFVYAIDHSPQISDPGHLHQAADLMRNWDGRITNDSVAANLVWHSRQELTRLLLEPPLGDAWEDYAWFMSSVWLENMLLHQPARWLPAAEANWNDLLVHAVTTVLQAPPAPGTWDGWQWGKEHKVDIEHPVFGTASFLRRWTGTGQQPQSGNGLTVKQVGLHFGPSERLTVDFSNLDNSTLNIVNGQSGNVLSPHYMDHWSAWYGGTTFLLPYSAEAVDRAKEHSLILEPQ